MFTSESKKTKSEAKTALTYLIISLALAAAGAVYEHFSFGVYSYFMIYAFAIPLVLGTLPNLTIAVNNSRDGKSSDTFGRVIKNWMYHAAVATLTVGSLMHGILAICGRPNSLTIVYPIAAAVLLAAAIIVTLRTKKDRTSSAEFDKAEPSIS